MKIKKLLALGMAATMMLSSSVVALAESGTGTGAGKVEGVVDTEVFSVVLPTTNETTLKFILDPQGLIKATSSAAYSGATFGEGTLFFQNAGDSISYSNTSDVLTVTNKSSVKADITVTAKITGNDNIALSSDDTFADDTTASMYMALVHGSDKKAIATSDGVELTATMDAATEGSYEYSYNSSASKYEYKLKDDVEDTAFAKYEFKLTGACNAKGDWTGLAEAAPSVEVTWNIVKHVDNAAPTFSAGSEVGVINYTKGAGDDGLESITSIVMVHPTNGAFDGYNAYEAFWGNATDAAGKITFANEYMSFYADKATYEATITYVTAGGETKTAKVDVKCQ